MKINDIKGKVNESLPSHLAKFFDKDGNMNPDAEERVQRGRAERKLKKLANEYNAILAGMGHGDENDVLHQMNVIAEPWGIDPMDFLEMYESVTETANTDSNVAKYLATDKKGRYFLLNYPRTPGSNPLHLQKQLQAKARELGFDRYDVIAQWSGDIDSEINNAKRIAASYEAKKNEFPTQYYGNIKKAEELENAKAIIADNTVEEARDPHAVINKFFDKKKAKAARSADLAKNPEKVKQMKSDEQLKEYKPGVTPLTREISFSSDEPSDSGMTGQQEYDAVKKIRWPYGVDVKFNDKTRTVRFKTAKMKTVAKLLAKHVDFGATSAGEVLDLPPELMFDDVDNLNEQSRTKTVKGVDFIEMQPSDARDWLRKIGAKGSYMGPATLNGEVVAVMEPNDYDDERVHLDYYIHPEYHPNNYNPEVSEAEVGDKIKYRNIKTKRTKTGSVKSVEMKNGQKRYEVDGGKYVYDSDLEEAFYQDGSNDENTYTLINTKNNKRVGHGAVYSSPKAAEAYLEKMRKHGKPGWKTAQIEIMSIADAKARGVKDHWKFTVESFSGWAGRSHGRTSSGVWGAQVNKLAKDAHKKAAEKRAAEGPMTREKLSDITKTLAKARKKK